jgi:addiction module RelB/DinJ family antitoxin
MKTLQIRLPEEDYARTQAVLEEIGLDLPTAVRLFLRKVVHTRSIPFGLEAPETAAKEAPGPTRTMKSDSAAAKETAKAPDDVMKP